MKFKSGFVKVISLIVLLIFTLTTLSCAVNPVTGKTQLMLYSEEGELDLGRRHFPSALWGSEGGGGEYKDERLRSYLEGIVMRLHKASHRPHLPLKFYIQNSSIPNAWALPGYVAITRGLLAELNNEAEFAFIMGHEIGHIAARHSAAHMSKYVLMQVGLVILGLSLKGKDYADLVLGLGVAAGGLLLLKYSRDDELEADRLGVLYMSKIGYNPRYAVEAHRTLERVVREYRASIGAEADDETLLGELLSTHPRTRVRIDEIEKLIAQTPKYPFVGDGVNRAYFQYMISDLKRVNRVYRDYYDRAVFEYRKGNNSRAESLVREAIRREPSQAPFYALLGMIHYRRGENYEAERNFRHALSLHSEQQPAIRGLGMLSYRRGNYREGIQILKRALALFPDDINSIYYIGLCHYELGQYSEALDYFKDFLEARPEHPLAHTYLAVCYENTGDILSAYEHYLKQLEIAPNNQEGRFAARRVAVLKPKVEALLEKQKQEREKKKKK